MERLLRPLDADAAPGWAAALVAEFGSIGRALGESSEARTRIIGDRVAAEFLANVGDAINCMLRERASELPVIGNVQAVLDYLICAQAHADVEIVRVLFLDTKKRLLKAEMLERGTVNEAALWPRQIVKRCLELNATAVILAHNHTSGDLTPSRADIDITRSVARHCATFDIALFDHIIVTDRGYTSLRTENLI